MQLLLEEIRKYKIEKKKLWWENYVKHETVFLGVPMADLRRSLNAWSTSNFDQLDHGQQAEIILELFSMTYAEEKLLGILLLSEHVKWSTDMILDHIEIIMSKAWIYDWNICDWLCVKVLTPILDKEDITYRLIKWSTDDYLWQRRAALVPFAQIKDQSTYKSIIFSISENLIARSERFSKTAVGWVLREMMQYNKDEVIDFMSRHYQLLTTEVINNILKHQSDKKQIKTLLKRIISF